MEEGGRERGGEGGGVKEKEGGEGMGEGKSVGRRSKRLK